MLPALLSLAIATTDIASAVFQKLLIPHRLRVDFTGRFSTVKMPLHAAKALGSVSPDFAQPARLAKINAVFQPVPEPDVIMAMASAFRTPTAIGTLVNAGATTSVRTMSL